ncbi:MAG: hypothetical protein Q8Q35_01940 [Nanoarchaeota archaeon]|nr:hypothetical protein [Nanoarchaeota archaeon]
MFSLFKKRKTEAVAKEKTGCCKETKIKEKCCKKDDNEEKHHCGCSH